MIKEFMIDMDRVVILENVADSVPTVDIGSLVEGRRGLGSVRGVISILSTRRELRRSEVETSHTYDFCVSVPTVRRIRRFAQYGHRRCRDY